MMDDDEITLFMIGLDYGRDDPARSMWCGGLGWTTVDKLDDRWRRLPVYL
jgi:hypothetical protein